MPWSGLPLPVTSPEMAPRVAPATDAAGRSIARASAGGSPAETSSADDTSDDAQAPGRARSARGLAGSRSGRRRDGDGASGRKVGNGLPSRGRPALRGRRVRRIEGGASECTCKCDRDSNRLKPHRATTFGYSTFTAVIGVDGRGVADHLCGDLTPMPVVIVFHLYSTDVARRKGSLRR